MLSSPDASEARASGQGHPLRRRLRVEGSRCHHASARRTRDRGFPSELAKKCAQWSRRIARASTARCASGPIVLRPPLPLRSDDQPSSFAHARASAVIHLPFAKAVQGPGAEAGMPRGPIPDPSAMRYPNGSSALGRSSLHEAKSQASSLAFGRSGGAEEDRTPDLRIANATLSQLSYRPTRALYRSAKGVGFQGQ